MVSQVITSPRSYRPLHIPKDAEPCRRCGVLIPVPGYVYASKDDDELCNYCAEEIKKND